ncbi:hypothetical protein ACN47E_009403 [Coniothyrium glycines]
MEHKRELPPNFSLFITTPNTIHLQSQHTTKFLFDCGASGGIMCARPSEDNDNLIAVADSHNVLLHDAAKGQNRKYILKTYDSSPRLLLFSADSRTLYFTTTLSTSVQVYSIPNGELSPSLAPHPSPPTVLERSDDDSYLVSASPNPPTIHIYNRRTTASAPVNFRPTDAHSPVTCAAFHTTGTSGSLPCTQLAIGFQDGALAVYRMLSPPPRPERTSAVLLQPRRVGVYQRLHKAIMGGVSAIKFIPGQTTRIISVGQDGRCRIVDFFRRDAQVLRT